MKFHHEFQLKNNGGTFAEYEADGIIMRLDFFEHILRVSLIHDRNSLLPTWSVDPDGTCPQSGRSKLSQKGFVAVSPVLYEKDGVVSFELYGLRFPVREKPGKSFYGLLFFYFCYPQLSGNLYGA